MEKHWKSPHSKLKLKTLQQQLGFIQFEPHGQSTSRPQDNYLCPFALNVALPCVSCAICLPFCLALLDLPPLPVLYALFCFPFSAFCSLVSHPTNSFHVKLNYHYPIKRLGGIFPQTHPLSFPKDGTGQTPKIRWRVAAA